MILMGSMAVIAATMIVGFLWLTVRLMRYWRFQRDQESRAQGMMNDEDFLAYLAELRKQHAKVGQESAGPEEGSDR